MKSHPNALPGSGTLGALDYDPLDVTLLCHVCGRRYRNLAQHARRAHSLSSDGYRDLAGLNSQTRLIYPIMREHLRETSTPLIIPFRAEGKLKRWNEDPAKGKRDKAAAVAVIRQGLAPEASRHRQATFVEHLQARIGDRGCP